MCIIYLKGNNIMFGLSRLVAYVIVFFMGFGLALGLFVGIPVAMVANYSLRDLENTNLVNIPDEQFFDQSVAAVDILGLNGLGLYNEFKELQTFEEADLNINTLEARYGIIFHEKLQLLFNPHFLRSVSHSRLPYKIN